MNEERAENAVFANDPGVFGAEVYVNSAETCLGLSWADGDECVQLTVLKGDEDIHLDLAPSDLPRLRQALDCCEQRMEADKKAFRTDADGEVDQP